MAARRHSRTNGRKISRAVREIRNGTLIREQPWPVVGIAGLVGIALGFLVARR